MEKTIHVYIIILVVVPTGIHQLAFFSEEDSSLSDEEVDSDEGQDSDQEYEGGLDLDQLERHSAGIGHIYDGIH